MSTLMLVAWLASGVLGAMVLWRLDKKQFNGDPTWCPTPRAILFFFCASPLGLILLAASLIIVLLEFLLNAHYNDSWFTRPICRRRRDD